MWLRRPVQSTLTNKTLAFLNSKYFTKVNLQTLEKLSLPKRHEAPTQILLQASMCPVAVLGKIL